jgi:hypothetical protein
LINLEDLWRFGIPVSVRRVLWPFKIGNKLGISKELFQINRKQGESLRRKVLSKNSEFEYRSSQQSQGQSVNSLASLPSNINASENGRILDLLTLSQITEDID